MQEGSLKEDMPALPSFLMLFAKNELRKSSGSIKATAFLFHSNGYVYFYMYGKGPKSEFLTFAIDKAIG